MRSLNELKYRIQLNIKTLFSLSFFFSPSNCHFISFYFSHSYRFNAPLRIQCNAGYSISTIMKLIRVVFHIFMTLFHSFGTLNFIEMEVSKKRKWMITSNGNGSKWMVEQKRRKMIYFMSIKWNNSIYEVFFCVMFSMWYTSWVFMLLLLFVILFNFF